MNKKILLSSILMSAGALNLQALEIGSLGTSLAGLESKSPKQALSSLNEIEDFLREYRSEKVSQKEWTDSLGQALPELFDLYAQERKNESKGGRSPASASLEESEYRDRIESLTLWVMKEVPDDLVLQLISQSGEESRLTALVHFLSRECEQEALQCRKERLAQATQAYRNLHDGNVQEGGALLLARAEALSPESKGTKVFESGALLADLDFEEPLRGLSSSEKPATAVVPHED
jgi:hypothetical protein